jgi:AcrR family transcriptional regulator
MEHVKPTTEPNAPPRARSRATRLRITKAATSLFGDRGYTGTTMADIAEAAGVAVQTVYFVFHTKTEVLNSAYGLAVMGEDQPAVPQQQAWYREAVAEPDVTTAIQLVVRGLAEILRRVAPLDRAVRTAAASDPDAASFLAQNEAWRAEGYREMVSFLRTKRAIRAEVTEDRAIDVMLFLASPGGYRTLVTERGWTHDEWIAWTSVALAEQLFGTGPYEAYSPAVDRRTAAV